MKPAKGRHNAVARMCGALLVVLLLLPFPVPSTTAQGADVPVALPSGVLAWWKGEGNFADSARTHTGTNVGSVTFVPGKVGQGFAFNTANYVEVADHPDVSLATAETFTVELWAKMTGTAPTYHLLGKRDSGCGTINYQMVAGAVSNFAWQIGSASGPLVQNEWTHLAATQNGTTTRLYRNGVEVGNGTTPVAGGISANLRLGTSSTCTPGFAGVLDEITFYSRALSRAEVESIHTAGAGGKQASLFVGNTGDLAGDPSPGDGVCGSNAATCNLRAAIEEANARSGVDLITFAGLGTIRPTSPLPTITEAVTIDATAAPRNPGMAPFQIDGLLAGNANGLTIDAPGVTVRGLSITNFAQNGIELLAGATGATIQGNHIGVIPFGGLVSNGIAPGRVSRYRGEGTMVDDVGGRNGSDATGTLTYTTGTIGQAFNFDGNDQVQHLGTAFTYQTFTLEMWLKAPNGSAQVRLADILDTAHTGTTNWVIQYDNDDADNRYHFGAATTVGGAGNGIVSFKLKDNTWQHVAITVGAGKVRAYLNGTLWMEDDMEGTIQYSSSFLRLGNHASLSRAWTGQLDELNIYNRVLAAEEIRFIHGSPTVRPPSNGNLQHGIHVLDADDVLIGEPFAPHPNVIGGNIRHGIAVEGDAVGTEIRDNHVGVDEFGFNVVRNGFSGLYMGGGSGALVGPSNVLSGNTDAGLWIAEGSDHSVVGNWIGMRLGGGSAAPNGKGVLLGGATPGQVDGIILGGPLAADKNVISGNAGDGIVLEGTGVALNQILGNYIGLDGGGNLARTNGLAGIRVLAGAHDNLIGPGNLISGNTQDGIVLEDPTTVANDIVGNTIGRSRLGAAVPNRHGVVLNGAADTLVGGYTSGAANVIANNNGVGVAVLGAATGNIITGNAIHTNTAGGIDLAANLATLGRTPNDVDDVDTGPHGFLNFPVVSSALPGDLRILGTLDLPLSGTPTDYEIDVYGSGSCATPQGATLLGTFSITVEVSGDAAFDETLFEDLADGTYITATATGASGTSEFSDCFQLVYVDSDGDTLLDHVETELGTDPNDADTDSDGVADGVEVSVADLSAGIDDTCPYALDPNSDLDQFFDGDDPQPCIMDAAPPPVPPPAMEPGLRFSTVPTSFVSGQPIVLGVRLSDSDGVDETSGDAEVTLRVVEGPAEGSLVGVLTRPAVDGLVEFPGLRFDRVGTYRIIAEAAGRTSATTAGLLVAPGPAAHLALSVPEVAPLQTGFGVSARILDAAGNLVPSTASATLAIQDGPFGAAITGSTASAVGGVVTFPAVTLSLEGTYWLSISSGALAPTESGPIQVVAGRLAVTSQPTTVTSGAGFTVAVDVLSSTGGSASAIVTLVKVSGPGILQGPLTVASVGGRATFLGLSFDKIGSYVLEAQAIGSAAGRSASIMVVPGAAASLAFANIPTDAMTSSPFTVVVEARDLNDNLVTVFEQQITISKHLGSATLQGVTSRFADDGVATFPGLQLQGSGNAILRAATPSIPGTFLSSPVKVQPAATRVALEAPAGGVVSGADFFLKATIVDNVGAKVPDATHPVTVQVISGPAGSPLLGTLVMPSLAGTATFTDLRLAKAGVYRLLATSPNLLGSEPIDVSVESGAPAQLAFEGVPTRLQTGDLFGFKVRLLDQAGNPTTATTPSIEILTVGGTSPPRSATPVLGAAQFSDVRFPTAGLYRLTARGHLLAPSVSPLLIVDAPDLPVVTQLSVSPPIAEVIAGSTASPFTVTALDATGVAVPGAVVSFRLVDPTSPVGTMSPNGTFAAMRTGRATIEASHGNLAATSTVVVIPGDLAQLRITPPAATTTRLLGASFIVQGLDAAGNVVPLTWVEWTLAGDEPTVLPPLVPFSPRTPLPTGAHAIVARVGANERTATLFVLAETKRESIPTLDTVVVDELIAGVHSATLAGAAVFAPQGASLSMRPTGRSNSLVADATVQLATPAQHLALLIETRPGDLAVPPPELDAASLSGVLDDLAVSKEPAIFIRVAATQGGQPLDSARLNELLGEMEIRFHVPAAYFAANKLSPDAVRLIEYSDHRLVTKDLAAKRVRIGPGGLTFEYETTIKEFSTFAIVGVALSTPAVTSGGGRQSQAVFALRSAVHAISTFDALVPQIEFRFRDGEQPKFDARPIELYDAHDRPRAARPVPASLEIRKWLEVHVAEGGPAPQGVTFHVVLTPAEVPDAQRAVLLHQKDDVWIPESRIDLELRGGLYQAAVHSTCCSMFAIAFDLLAPNATASPPKAAQSGTVALAALVEDNLAIARVDAYIDGAFAGNSTTAPFHVTVDTTHYENGNHTIRFVAYDFVGNQAEAVSSAFFLNSPAWASESEATLNAPSLVKLFMPLIGLSAVFAAGFVALRMRTRRPIASIETTEDEIMATDPIAESFLEEDKGRVAEPMIEPVPDVAISPEVNIEAPPQPRRVPRWTLPFRKRARAAPPSPSPRPKNRRRWGR